MYTNRKLIVETKSHGKVEVMVEGYNPITRVYTWKGINENHNLRGAFRRILNEDSSTESSESKNKHVTTTIEHPEYGRMEVSLSVNPDTGNKRIIGVGIEGDAMVTMADLSSKDRKIVRNLVRDTKIDPKKDDEGNKESSKPSEDDALTDDDLPDFLK